MRMIRTLMCALAALALGAGAARATETQWWTHDGAGDYAKAETRGVVVRPEGTLELGPAVTSVADDSLRAAWAVLPLADGSVAIGGDHGRIDRWTASGGIRPWVKLGSGQVLCLARDGDGLVAGTGPRGRIYRIGAKGDTTLLANTGERYVWALASAGRGEWWAASGTRGRLLRVRSGATTLVFDSDESNLVSLTDDGRGGVYFGGDSKGRIYHALAGGGVRTEYDAAEDEIRALARTSDGALWAAALSVSAVNDDGDDDEKPQPAKAAVQGGRATLYRLVPDSATVAWWNSPQPIVFALAPGRDGLIAATGNRAGVFRIEGYNSATQLLAPPQGQVTALAAASDGAVWCATSNPVTLQRLGPARASEGELISSPLDARRFARFGRVRWHGAGGVQVLTRSGNSDTADSTWSAWQALASEEGGGRVQSPAARHLQYKVRLNGGDARLDDIAIAWREQNLAPIVSELVVAPQAQGFRDGEIGARTEAVTQSLPSGQKVEYSISLPANKPIRELPIWARGLRSLQWRGSDPNGDALRYKLEIRPEDSAKWIVIGKDLEASVYTWNTNSLPDGRYRLRVTASDAAGNALGEERTGEALSEPFGIDNTPPTIPRLEGRGAHLEGEASDATSPVVRLEYAVDDGDWRMLAPVGGLADAPTARFVADLPGLEPGDHLVSVRAIDMAGNAATRAVRVQVSAGK